MPFQTVYFEHACKWLVMNKRYWGPQYISIKKREGLHDITDCNNIGWYSVDWIQSGDIAWKSAGQGEERTI